MSLVARAALAVLLLAPGPAWAGGWRLAAPPAPPAAGAAAGRAWQTLSTHETQDACEQAGAAMLRQAERAEESARDRLRDRMQEAIGKDALEADVPAFVRGSPEARALERAEAHARRLAASRCAVSPR
ncbi:MAG: hypothetical protein HYS77_06135 [Candidatus Rokubacteria bacterium]|nr:hypothetical protein [Candidatus Rokubacteria bacterium]MBI2015101.1 hypothetical protein [Candidatus Rokubacteria bacterium]